MLKCLVGPQNSSDGTLGVYIMRRRKMSKRSSRKNFSRGHKVNRKNIVTTLKRGGGRL